MGNFINKTNTSKFKHITLSNEGIDNDFKIWSRTNNKDFKTIYYYSNKQFKSYVKDLPEDEKIVVIGNILAGQRKYKEKSENEKLKDKIFGVVNIPNIKGEKPLLFDLKESKDKNIFLNTMGYVKTSDGSFIRLVRKSLWPLFLIAILAILIACCFIFNNDKSNPVGIEDGDNLPAYDVDNEYNLPPNYIFPQFEDVTITSEKTDIGLYNPEENKEGTQFYLTLDGEEVAIDESGNPIITKVDSPLYLAYKLVEDENIIFETQYLTPGKQRSVNLYDLLDSGEHTIDIVITSYSPDDDMECTSYTNTIKVTIEK